MKQLVIIIGTTLLGCVIYSMMVGPGENTLMHAVGSLMGTASGVSVP